MQPGSAVAVFVLAIALLPLRAVERPTFTVDVSVVNVFATVRDRQGRLVTDLDKDDFVLEEGGNRQEIKYFSRQSDVPLTLGLLVDTSVSQRRLIRAERRASAQFFDQVLRPREDLAFVIKFDFEVALLASLTGDKRYLRNALDDLRVMRFGQIWRDPRIPPPRSGSGTSMFDAIYLACDEILDSVEGRKAIVLITDGVDMGSIMSLHTAIEYAHRADTIIYGVRYFDPHGYFHTARRLFGGGPGRKGSKTLRRLASETGGKSFDVGEELTLGAIFNLLQEELRSQYSIGYTPAGEGAEFRAVKLRTKNKKLTVQARTGYYPKPER